MGAYPAGIPTRLVTAGGSAWLESGEPAPHHVLVKASAAWLEWAATGFTLPSKTWREGPGETPGSPLVFELPATDQVGKWRDERGLIVAPTQLVAGETPVTHTYDISVC